MKSFKFNCLILFIILPSLCLGEDEAPKGVPYNSLKAPMALVKGKEIDGVICCPFYLKPNVEGAKIDVKEADFRIVTKEGKKVPLKCDELSKLPEERQSKMDKSAMEDGYTHVLWVPESVEEYRDGTMMHSLPKGFLQVMAGVVFTNKK